MSFLETVERARVFLERNGRVSLRALQREFDLDDESLDELIEELVEIQRVAARDGRALAWAGGVPPAPTETSTPARDPRDYTPKHLADKILQSKSAIEGERKQVTVLFADVKSSMELSEDLDPEAWHGILDRFFQILAEGVHRFEGTVNQYTGDGIMALFGAPIAHEDHAQRACYAALRLRDELRSYCDELRLERGLNVSVRMGLHSGEVVVGKIGDDLRMDYTAQGHTVGLAQRMEQLAESGRVYLTGATRELAVGYFELRDLGPTAVKGVRDPVRVYELEGVGVLRSRFDLSRARGLSVFVGRKDEMTTLEAALERTSAGEGQVVGVVAQAGTGKSRLCHEFVERCRARGVFVRHAQCLSHGKTTPLLPVVELLSQTFEIDERDSPQTVRSKIAGTVVLVGGELEPDLPLVFDLMGVPDPDRPTSPLPPEERQRRIMAIVRRFIQARSERDTGVLLIEDLHWMDGASESFIAEAAQTIDRSRNLLLLNFRPEYHADWMQGTSYQQIPLRALGPEDSDELLDHLLGADSSLAELRGRIREASGGNPFFIEELVRSLAEAGSLEGAQGAYRLASSDLAGLALLALPSSVQAVLAARIDRLPDEPKRVLHAASVIGDRFSESLLNAVAGSAIDGALRELIAAEFLYEEAIYPEREVAFVHPLTREVAYHTQLAGSRATLHAAAARALSTDQPEAPGSHAALLAHHFDEAGEALPAARWHALAARWSGIQHPAQAFSHLERVRELTDALDPSSEVDELGAMARVQLLLAGARIGTPAQEIRPLYDEGIERARRSGNRGAQAWLLTAFANYRHQTEGVVDAVIPDLEEAVRLAVESGDLNLEVTARYNLSIALLHQDPPRAADLLGALVEQVSRNPDAELALFASAPTVLLWLQVTSLCWLGRLTEAAATQRELERLSGGSGSEFSQIQVLSAAATLACERGDATSLRLAVQVHELIAEDAAPATRLLSYSRLFQAHEVAGDHSAALDAAEKALAIIREHRAVVNFEALPLCGVARQRARCGEPESGLALAEEALTLSLERGSRLGEAQARHTRALCLLLARGAAGAAEIEAELDRAVEVAERTGQRGIAAQILELRAELADALGNTEERRRWLGEAESAYREMGATGHAQRLAAELAP